MTEVHSDAGRGLPLVAVIIQLTNDAVDGNTIPGQIEYTLYSLQLYEFDMVHSAMVMKGRLNVYTGNASCTCKIALACAFTVCTVAQKLP